MKALGLLGLTVLLVGGCILASCSGADQNAAADDAAETATAENTQFTSCIDTADGILSQMAADGALGASLLFAQFNTDKDACHVPAVPDPSLCTWASNLNTSLVAVILGSGLSLSVASAVALSSPVQSFMKDAGCSQK